MTGYVEDAKTPSYNMDGWFFYLSVAPRPWVSENLPTQDFYLFQHIAIPSHRNTVSCSKSKFEETVNQLFFISLLFETLKPLTEIGTTALFKQHMQTCLSATDAKLSQLTPIGNL